jgi:hypothetical protein
MNGISRFSPEWKFLNTEWKTHFPQKRNILTANRKPGFPRTEIMWYRTVVRFPQTRNFLNPNRTSFPTPQNTWYKVIQFPRREKIAVPNRKPCFPRQEKNRYRIEKRSRRDTKMHDGILNTSEPHNSTLGTVLRCRDEIDVEFNMVENDPNRVRQLSLLIDYHEGQDEEGFIVSRRLETVTFIFDLKDHTQKYELDRNTFADQFLTTDKAKEMFSDTFSNSHQDVVESVFNSLKHFIVGHCDRNKILM